ncbi:MAG: hypothetical protein J5902_02150 [Paludibacteraceae bacterium]|nr:hypothetical protein [Paludibacteraceae bacterium]
MKNAVNRAFVAKKRAISIQLSAFRRSILVFILCSFSAAVFTPIKAQEAFYIYRNDGNFNGFFYDEVVQMNYSKTGLDSVEYEQYVTYEVVLADTTYRIPLASIDSIGFQQPEIKFNPKVKFIEKDGYCPYFWFINGSTSGTAIGVYFRDLPEHMIPQVGDVLIGLPTDPIAEEKYIYGIQGSFSCKVKSVTLSDDADDDGPFKACHVEGAPVEALGDVFTQFVMVEQIGYDKEGNQIMHRASARMPEGFPQPKRVRKAEDASEVKLIDFESTITRQWQPGGSQGSTAIEMSADVGIQVKFRVAYNISWTRLMVTIANDVVTKIKPSLNMNVSSASEYRLGDIITYPRNIKLPVQCPIFELDPSPDIFLRWEGKMQAKLNLPQARIGVGVHYGIDTDNLFPITCGLHLVPDDAPEPSEDMLDLSGEVSFDSYVQAGLKFGASLSTNSWIKKIFYGQIGLYLYAGPKIGGRVAITADLLNLGGGDLYYAYSKSLVYATALSLDLEAKATAQAFWKDPVEKKFFDKNWSFGCDTMRLAPKFDKVNIAFTDQDVVFNVPSKQERILSYSKLGLKIYSSWNDSLIATLPDIDYDHTLKDFTFSYPLKDLQAGITYETKSAITYAGHGPYEGYLTGGERFRIPYNMKLDADEMHFDFTGGEKSITFTANCSRNDISVHFNDASSWESSYRIETVDEAQNKYKLTVKATPNRQFFGKRVADQGERRPWIAGAGDSIYHYFNFVQDENDLKNVKLSRYFDGQHFWDTEGHLCSFGYLSDSLIAGVRNGENQIVLSRVTNRTSGNTNYVDEVNITLQKTVSDEGVECAIVSGYLKTTQTYTESSGAQKIEVIYGSFENISSTFDGSYSLSSTPLTVGTYDCEERNAEGEIIKETHTTMQPGSTISYYLQAGVPAQ